MKPALIAAVMLAFVVYLAPRSKAEQDANDVTANAKNNHPSTITPSVQGHQATQDNAAGNRQPPRGDSPAQWILIVVTAITAGFIGWQAWETRRAASATRDTVKSVEEQTRLIERSVVISERNTDALIASERAWIHGDFTGRVIMAGVVRYSLTVTNQGKTPAQICGYDIWHGLLTEGTPFYKEKLTTHFTESKQIFVGGGQTETLRDDFALEDLFTLESGETAASKEIPQGAFCVTIRYGDVLTKGDQRKEHHTSFVYLCNLFFNKIDRISEYNDYT